MTENEIKALSEEETFKGNPFHSKIVETHISWILFTKEFVFKIKKPIKLSFLDYSSLELRKQYCEKEIKLNSRYTHIYLAVLPIYQHSDKWSIGENEGKLADYAVQMKRMDSSREMDKLLEKEMVSKKQIDKLTDVISAFHLKAEKVYTPFDVSESKKTFNDIQIIKAFTERELDDRFSKVLDQSINWSNQFLDQHSKRLQQRIDQGFKRDVHGDLHSGNIFLYDKPILFDCIEFNDDFRQIDLLYEIAFMCMDLEAFDRRELSDHFLSSYLHRTPCMERREDESIFTYFKCLRANIRAKVHAINANQSENEEEKQSHIEEVKKYFQLMKNYFEKINFIEA